MSACGGNKKIVEVNRFCYFRRFLIAKEATNHDNSGMNPMLVNFVLFLIWIGVGLTFLIFGPMFAPNSFKGTQHEMYMGFIALLLAIWNLMRWWMTFSARRTRQRMEDNYRERLGPTAEKDPPPIVNPEFKFDEPPSSGMKP